MTFLQVLGLIAVSAVVTWLVWTAYFRGHYRHDRPTPDLSGFEPRPAETVGAAEPGEPEGAVRDGAPEGERT